MPPIYTCDGDDGSTSVLGGKRLSKAHQLIAALGDLDELNTVLGLARAFLQQDQAAQLIECLQHDIITLSAELACGDKASGLAHLISADDIARLEAAIDEREQKLPPLKEFVIPGASQSSAILHFARAVCRRAERGLVVLHQERPLRSELLSYINRLSDLLFVLAREAAETR